MTDFRIEISGPPDGTDAEDHLRSLLSWLREDGTPTLRARAAGSAPAAPGSMGAGLDILQLAIGSGLSAASLVFSVLQWQASRRRAPAVTLRRGDVEVVLTAQAAGDEETVRGIIDLLDRQVPPAPAHSEESGGDDRTA
ncbi:effector-associated constant component EACC1 [Streptomyces mutabilis]|uniref:effector-associated constant component EACC1 n=1 Tax=Streptomyces mutabilis TaxID=67332 RepID=UPI0034DF1759